MWNRPMDTPGIAEGRQQLLGQLTGLPQFPEDCPLAPQSQPSTGLIRFAPIGSTLSFGRTAPMQRKNARLSVSATPPAPAAAADLRESVAATALPPDAAIPGQIHSDSLTDKNRTESNLIRINQSESDPIRPQKIKKSAPAPRLIPSRSLFSNRGNPGQTGANQGKPDLSGKTGSLCRHPAFSINTIRQNPPNPVASS